MLLFELIKKKVPIATSYLISVIYQIGYQPPGRYILYICDVLITQNLDKRIRTTYVKKTN